MINKFLFKQIDNSALILFRMVFGLLCLLETVGAIFTGWVKRTLIDPEFTFSFIGLEWLQPLPDNGMYFYYAFMGLLGGFIMLGYKYHWSTLLFTVLWAGSYFMQKSSYNNHYYLLLLLSGIMAIQPANTYASVDCKLHPEITSYSMPNWSRWIFIFQMLIVYTYGAIAKIYPDWLNTTVISGIMKSKSDYFLVGSLLQESWVHYFLTYGGILFDGLIIPLFLIKRTRTFAFGASIFFHLFNSFILHVGIFPYLSLAFALFFYPPEVIHKLFFKSKKPFYNAANMALPKHRNIFVTLLSIYFFIQLILPVRHYFIKDDVLWTEEGHRMSWRMMLRARSGMTSFTVKNHTKKTLKKVKLSDYLSEKQIRLASTKPDAMWQFARHLKTVHAQQGDSVSVYVHSKISINGTPLKPFINPEVDLAAVPWSPFTHSDWILPSK